MIVRLLLTMLLVPAADSPLADAAMQGDLGQVRSLLAENADVNVAQGDGSTALHWAAYRDDSEMARVLLEAGANVGATTRIGDFTPLLMAARSGSAAIIELLLSGGSDVNAPNAAASSKERSSDLTACCDLDLRATLDAHNTSHNPAAEFIYQSFPRR